MIHFHIKYKTMELLKDIALGLAQGILFGIALIILFIGDDWTW